MAGTPVTVTFRKRAMSRAGASRTSPLDTVSFTYTPPLAGETYGVRCIAFDGTNLLFGTTRSTGFRVGAGRILTVSPSTGEILDDQDSNLGSSRDVTAIAAQEDPGHIYVLAEFHTAGANPYELFKFHKAAGGAWTHGNTMYTLPGTPVGGCDMDFDGQTIYISYLPSVFGINKIDLVKPTGALQETISSVSVGLGAGWGVLFDGRMLIQKFDVNLSATRLFYMTLPTDNFVFRDFFTRGATSATEYNPICSDGTALWEFDSSI